MPALSRKNKTWRIAYAVCLGYWGSALSRALPQASAFAESPAYQIYGRVQWWILSARCTQMRKVFLCACGPQGQLYPMENISLAEDRGHNLLANIVAYTLREPFDRKHLAEINIGLNALAVVTLSALFILVSMPWAAVLCLLWGTLYGIPGPIPGPDVQSGFLGIFCLGLVPVIWAASLWYGNPSRQASWAGFLLSLCTLIWVNLLRESMGMSSTIMVVLLTLSRWVFKVRRPSLKKALGICLLALLTLGSTTALLELRNELWRVEPRRYIESHGLAHNLYIGLGTEPNPWGIRYTNDAYGLLAAQKVQPDVEFCTPRYFQILRRLYLQLLFHYPGQVLKIYLQKTKRVFFLPLRFLYVPLWVYLTFLALAWPWFWHAARESRNDLVIVAGILGSIGFLALQGVLAKPDFQFLYPLKIGVLLLLACMIDFGIHSVVE